MKKIVIILIVMTLMSGLVWAKEVNVKFNFPLDFATQDVFDTVTINNDENAYTAFVLAAQANNIELSIDYYDFDGDGSLESAFISKIDGLGASEDWSEYWQFSQNNSSSFVGISASFPDDGDTVSLDYLNGFEEDAIEWLADNQKESGIIGNNSFQNSFALMGLSMAGQNNVSLDSGIVNDAIDNLLTHQENDAGFGNDLTTATAIMALLSNGKELTDFLKTGKNSIENLRENQMDDGGFKSGSNESDVDTTSWAMISFAQAGYQMPENDDGKSPVDYLLSAQHENGSYGYNASDLKESIDFTEEALIALAVANRSAENSVNWLSSKQNEQGCISDGFRTALGSIAFRMHGETDKADKALECLKTLAKGDGSFGRTTNSSNALDTGLALIALSSEEFPLTVSESLDTDGMAGLNSIVKFVVQIKNTGKVKAENVSITLDGLAENWVFDSGQGSIDFFDEIKPGETKTAEIFAQMKDVGNFEVKANVSTKTRLNDTSSTNFVEVNVEQAKLDVSIGFE